MKPRFLPVFMQAFLLMTLAPFTSAQPQTLTDLSEWRARSEQFISKLKPEISASSQYGLRAILRHGWDGTGWFAQSRTIHSYNGLVRVESIEEDWDLIQWMPSSRTRYRVDGLVELIEQWSPPHNDYLPVTRYEYSFTYDLFTGQPVVSGIVMQIWNGVDWGNSERTTYVVEKPDPSGNLLIVGGLEEFWGGSEWTPIEDFAIQQVGDDVVQTSRLWDAALSQWVNFERRTFRSSTITALYERLEAVSRELGDFEEMTIGLMMIPDNDVEVWDAASEGWTAYGRRVTEMFHFGTGKPAVILDQLWDGTAWSDLVRQEVTYSLEGKIESSAVTYSEGGDTGTIVESYTYDDRGLVAEVVTELAGEGLSFPVGRAMLSWIELIVGTEDGDELPSAHVLNPAYPNPFNPSTTLSYKLSTSDRVRISIYDMLGKTVTTLVDGPHAAGSHTIQFDASGLSSGLYTVRMYTSRGVESRIITLVK